MLPEVLKVNSPDTGVSGGVKAPTCCWMHCLGLQLFRSHASASFVHVFLCLCCVALLCVVCAVVLQVARPSWSKVRWINVQGLSWDVITTLAVAFDLHPLVGAAAASS